MIRSEAESLPCPLCGSEETELLARVYDRGYLRCRTCRLAFLHPRDRLDPEAERERYELHENDPADPRYRSFLDRLCVPLVERLSSGAEGLDYGAGPGPTLSVMLEERGFSMEIYDPFFAPDPSVLQRRYDFVTCTETAEHFFRPDLEFGRLAGLLKPGGWLALMTRLRRENHSFEEWHYVRDPTHVCFYQKATLEWIATRHAWQLELPAENVAFFRASRS